VILKEGTPSLRGRFSLADQVLAETGLTDVDAKLEQFAVDARRAPEWILAAQLADQIPNVRPTGLPVTDLPGPEQAGRT
jgi:hypothetical protein